MPLVHMLNIPSVLMNSLMLKSFATCLLTVMHSRGFVKAAAKHPATNPHGRLYNVFDSLTFSYPTRFLRDDIMVS